ADVAPGVRLGPPVAESREDLLRLAVAGQGLREPAEGARGGAEPVESVDPLLARAEIVEEGESLAIHRARRRRIAQEQVESPQAVERVGLSPEVAQAAKGREGFL